MLRCRILGHRFRAEDSADLGRWAPLIGLLPLRIWRALRSRAKSGG